MAMGALASAGTSLGSGANPSDFANRTQTFFNPKLLKALMYNLRLTKYGLSEGYTTIGDKIRFFRPRKASLSYINAQTRTFTVVPLVTPTVLTEGVKPTNLTEVGVGFIDIALTQRAGYAELTDKLQALDLLNTLKVYSETMGYDAALDYDTVCRNHLTDGVINSNNTYNNDVDGGYFERFANVANSGNSSADFATLAGLAKGAAKITRAEALKCVTQLKTSKVPKIGGRYVAMVSPQVVHDMRQDTTWTQTGAFQDKNMLFDDAELMLDGVVYVQMDNPWVEYSTYGTESNTDTGGTGLIYSTIFLGEGAFGIPNLTNKIAGGSQSAPRLIVLNTPDKADPINQKTTIGWKSFFGAGAFVTSVNLERPRYVILRSKSTFLS